MNLLMPILFLYFSLNGITKQAHLPNSWYPKDKILLNSKLDTKFGRASKKYSAQINNIKAIIVPHAGIDYAGEVAASVYKLLEPANISRIIILAPSHNLGFKGVALPNFDSYQTPLGTLQVDKAAIKQLEKNKSFVVRKQAFAPEHSLEIQLPFIQKIFKDKKLQVIPLIVGDTDCNPKAIAKTIQKIITPRTLIIASSDFTHYGPNFNYQPFKTNLKENIKLLDAQAIEAIQKQSPELFCDFLTKTKDTICGRNAIKVLLTLLEQKAFGKPLEARLVAYDTSGAQTKDFKNSVSYVGLVFTEQVLKKRPIEKLLTQFEKDMLKEFAWNVLHNIYDSSIDLSLKQPIKSPGLMLQNGIFITLEKNGKLRGCIGRITTEEPIYKSTEAMTKATALNDTRFSPVTKDELKDLTLDVSILEIPHEATLKQIVIPGDGVILNNNNKQSVFLPEVAVEQKWNKEKTLEELSLKAGLPKNAWQDKNTTFKIFKSNKF